MDKLLYFAMGSNLNENQMRSRCSSARIVGPATLPRYRLAFCSNSQRWDGGVATAIYDRAAQVQGVLYESSPEGLFTLDLFEGVPWIYQRREKVVVRPGGERVTANVYLARDREPNKPSPKCFEVIYNAYRKHAFDLRELSAAIREVSHG